MNMEVMYLNIGNGEEVVLMLSEKSSMKSSEVCSLSKC